MSYLKPPSARQFYLDWLPPLAVTLGILIFSGDLGSSAHTQKVVEWLLSWLPFAGIEQVQEGHGYLRKAGHIAVYAGLYFFWFRAWRGHFFSRLRPAILWSLGLCLLTAMVDEGHQAMLPSRDGSLTDVALDFGAAALAALALSLKRI